MTLDMTKNRVPYELLTDEERAALHTHMEAGGAIENFVAGEWEVINGQYWYSVSIYRTVPLPKTLTQDVIAWEKLPDWAEWVARDATGKVCAYHMEPVNRSDDWVSCWNPRTAHIDDFPGLVQIGTCDWSESKQRRPRG